MQCTYVFIYSFFLVLFFSFSFSLFLSPFALSSLNLSHLAYGVRCTVYGVWCMVYTNTPTRAHHTNTPIHPYIHTPIHPYTHTPIHPDPHTNTPTHQYHHTSIHPWRTHTPIQPYILIHTPTHTPILPSTGKLQTCRPVHSANMGSPPIIHRELLCIYVCMHGHGLYMCLTWDQNKNWVQTEFSFLCPFVLPISLIRLKLT
jgi:hypothetical protein